jgi:hypothetical protein
VVAGLAVTSAVLSYATQKYLVAPNNLVADVPEVVTRAQQLMPALSAVGLLVAGVACGPAVDGAIGLAKPETAAHGGPGDDRRGVRRDRRRLPRGDARRLRGALTPQPRGPGP